MSKTKMDFAVQRKDIDLGERERDMNFEQYFIPIPEF